ncbi:MAG: C25 family cysteine peptidase [Anaerolineales bacterium]|nr:C25 family cysteine peptidase [Anaerolineales bacterium]MDW8447160.1 C25 family cysteine peptidase [Anaerolineales bacterium]
MKKLMQLSLAVGLFVGFFGFRATVATGRPGREGFRLIRADETGVAIQFHLGEYAFERVELEGEIYDRITLGSASNVGEPGKPSLPLVTTAIGIPPEAEVFLRIEELQTQVLEGQYMIEPAPGYYMEGEELAAGMPFYFRNEETYGSLNPYPGTVVELGEAAKLRSQRILPIRIYPFQFTPAAGKLEVVAFVRFVVEFRYPAGQPTLESSSALAEEENPFDPVYRQSLLNYQEAKRYRTFGEPKQPELQLLTQATDHEWYKIVVTEDGIYKVTYESLRAAGMPVDTLDPRAFAMVNQGRPVAIYVHDQDGDEGKFSPGEYLLFFGERFDGNYLASLYSGLPFYEGYSWRKSFYRPQEYNATPFEPRFNRHMVEKYTNRNVYWLSYNGDGGPFMNEVDASPGSAPIFSDPFQQRLRFEEQNTWWTTHFTSEDTFFWQRFQISGPKQGRYSLSIPSPAPHGMAVLRGELIARAHSRSVRPDHRAVIFINQTQIGTITWDGLERHRFELSFPASYLVDGRNTLLVEFQLVEGLRADEIFVNWFEVEYPRRFVAYRNTLTINRPLTVTQTEESIFLPLVLRSATQGGNSAEDEQDSHAFQPQIENTSWDSAGSDEFWSKGDSSFEDRVSFSGELGAYRIRVEGFRSAEPPVILDVRNPLQPSLLRGGSFRDGVLEFQASLGSGIAYFIQVPKTITSAQIERRLFEDILTSEAEYLYIAPREFIPATQSLAAYRQTKDGLTTKVIALEELVDQFNFGIYHPIAIKNYLRTAYSRWLVKPKFVLLVGDGHWNFLGSPNYDRAPIYMPPNLQWVDPWQGEVDSANDLVAVDSDGVPDPLPDLLVGRLPVNSGEEILAYLNKVQIHESTTTEAWQKHFVFVADAKDSAGDFPTLSDRIIQDYLSSANDVRKFYLNPGYGSYASESRPDLPCGVASGGNQCPDLTQALIARLNAEGAGHLVYSGHGFIGGWSKAVVFSVPDVDRLANGNRLPIVLTLNCLDGYWFYPRILSTPQVGPSLIEVMLRSPGRGAVAAFSPTGLGLATAHDALQRKFYDFIFAGDAWRIGSASTVAKLDVYSCQECVDLIHTYTVFGDPALLSPSPR